MVDHGGHGFCQNFESIPKDRLKNIGSKKESLEELQKHKFEFYARRYKEHLRSVKLTVQKKKILRKIVDLFADYGDANFLLGIFL